MIATSALGSVLLLAIGQSTSAVPDERNENGPPHEGLLRARAKLDGLLSCNLENWQIAQRDLDQKYARRMAAVQALVEREFGEAEARRDFIIVGGCLVFRSERGYQRAYRSAMSDFLRRLHHWEQRYRGEAGTIK